MSFRSFVVEFDEADKRFLINQFDDAIQNVHQSVILKLNLEKQLKINTDIDFIFGWLIGFVERAFYLFFSERHGRMPDEKEQELINEIFDANLGRLRDASKF